MSTYSVRCRNGSCRHRRVIARHPDTYKRPPACPACDQVKGWRIESRDYNSRNLCSCSGPEASQEHGKPFPHRTTHPLCDQHRNGLRNQALRRGVAPDDLPLDLMGEAMHHDDPCPF